MTTSFKTKITRFRTSPNTSAKTPPQPEQHQTTLRGREASILQKDVRTNKSKHRTPNIVQKSIIKKNIPKIVLPSEDQIKVFQEEYKAILKQEQYQDRLDRVQEFIDDASESATTHELEPWVSEIPESKRIQKKAKRRDLHLVTLSSSDQKLNKNFPKDQTNFLATQQQSSRYRFFVTRRLKQKPNWRKFIIKRGTRRGYWDRKRNLWHVPRKKGVPRPRKKIQIKTPRVVTWHNLYRMKFLKVRARPQVQWRWPVLQTKTLTKENLKFEYNTRNTLFHKNREFPRRPLARIAYRPYTRLQENFNVELKQAGGSDVDLPIKFKRLIKPESYKILSKIGRRIRRKRAKYLTAYKRIIKKHGRPVPRETNANWVKPTRPWLAGHLDRTKKEWDVTKNKFPWRLRHIRKLLYPPSEWMEKSTLERLDILGESKNIDLTWEVIPPNDFNRIELVTRIIKKIANSRTLNPTRYRQRLQPLLSKRLIWKLKRKQQIAVTREIKNSQPHHGLVYQLLPRRWHSPRDERGLPLARSWPSTEELQRRERLNIHRTKIGLKRKYFPDPAFREIEVRTGIPGTLGYVRQRRVFRSRFNLNRWWRPQLPFTPQQHPINFLAYSSPGLKKQKNKKKFISKLNWWNRVAHPNLEKGVFEASQLYLANNWGWSKAIAELATPGLDHPIWSNISHLVTESQPANIIRKAFITHSANWLQERLVEQAALSVSVKQWTNYTGLRKSDDTSPLTGKEIRSRFLNLSRRELFVQQPNWWLDETTRRINSLITLAKTINNQHQPVKCTTFIKLYITHPTFHLDHTVSNLMVTSKYEDTMFTFFAKLILPEQLDDVKSAIALNQNQILDLTDKQFRTFYQRWLKTKTMRLKTQKTKISSPSYDEERGQHITDLGVALPRFRGRARRTKTFESALRSYYERTMAPVFRRTHGPRFKHVKPYPTRKQYRAEKFALTNSMLQQRRLSKRLNGVTYFNKSWRRISKARIARQTLKPLVTVSLADASAQALQTTTVDSSQPGGFKKRFISLPIRFLIRRSKAKRAALKPLVIKETSATVHRLLHKALRQRTVARRLRDLKKLATRRKLPREQDLPPWIKARLRRRHLHRSITPRRGRYLLPTYYQRKWENFWALAGLNLRLTRSRPYRQTDYKPLRQSFSQQKRLRRRAFVKYGLTSTRYKVLKQTLPSLWTKTELKRKDRDRKIINKKFRKFKPAQKWRRRRRRSRWWWLKKERTKKRSGIHRPLRKCLKRTQLKLIQIRKTLNRVSKIASKTKNKIISSLRRPFGLTPFQFRRATRDVVLSDGEIARNLAEIRKTRRERYRLLNGRLETLTSFFPEFIRWLMINKFNLKTQTPQTLQHLVKTIYWSLRFHFSHDEYGKRLAARDANVAQRKTLWKEVATSAWSQYFEREEEEQTRFRVQPFKINKHRSQYTGIIHWYRRFLPKLYDLYREDPEKYSSLKITVSNMYRGNLTYANPSNWKTRAVYGDIDNKFKHLSRTRASSARFETALITSRRNPISVGYGLGAGKLVYAQIAPTRDSFFRRTFSSMIETKRLESQKLVFDKTNQLILTSWTDRQLLPTAEYIHAQRRGKERTIARAKANQTMSRYEGGTGTIDPRLLRLKSPRSQQYIIRKITKAALDEQMDLRRKHQVRFNELLLSKMGITQEPYQQSRGFIVPFVTEPNLVDNTILNQTRSAFALRRAPDFISAYAATFNQDIAKKADPEPYTTYETPTSINRKRVNALTLFYEKLAKAKAESVQVSRLNRSILHSHVAKNRSIRFNLFARAPRLVTKSIAVRRTHRHSSFNRLLKRHEEKLAKKRTRKYRKIGPEFQTKKQRQDALAIETRRKRMFVRALKREPKKKEQAETFSFSFTTKKPPLPNTKKISWASTKKFLKITGLHKIRSVFLRRATRISNYTNSVKELSRGRSFMKTLKHKPRTQIRLIPKAEAWAALPKGDRSFVLKKFHSTWFRITSFKNKKERLIKKWLMHTRRGLKRRNFKGMPLENYKLSRIRIRKLEWREFDDRFERKDFKRKATKFHISERRRIPWLENLVYPRTFYRTQRGRYRRDQAPQEYKNNKWLQYFRKALATTNPKALYIKRRRWPKLRIANYRFHLPMFELRNSRVAQRRLMKISRHRSRDSQFQQFMRGQGNRLDVTLLLMNIASSPFWARALAPMGLIAVNGKVVYDRAFRLQPGDIIRLNPQKITSFRTFMTPSKRKWEAHRIDRITTAGMSKNFYYYHKVYSAIYDRFPRYEDIARNNRVNRFLFTMFCHEAGRNRT